MVTKKKPENAEELLRRSLPQNPLLQPVPSQQKPKEEDKTRKVTSPEVIRNQDTGVITGVNLPDGRQFVGIPPAEVRALVNKFNKEQALPVGAVEASQIAEEEQKRQLNEQFLTEADKTLLNLSKEDFTKLQPKDELNPVDKLLAGQTPQQILNPENTVGGALKATAGVTAVSGAVALGLPLLTGAVGGQATAILSRVGASTKTIAGISVASVFQYLTGGRINELEKDIKEAVRTTKPIGSLVAGGADPISAIAQIEAMEQEIRWKIGELNVAIRRSPKDLIIGKDSQGLAREQLTILASRKLKIQQYMLTKDPSSLLAFDGLDEDIT
jgi:hypothetical protein